MNYQVYQYNLPSLLAFIHPLNECYKTLSQPKNFIKLIAKFILESFKPYQAILKSLSLKKPIIIVNLCLIKIYAFLALLACFFKR